jgi:hypothetical protein
MKRIIVLLVFLICFNLSALDILSAEFSLELGWLPQGTLAMYESREMYDLSNTFYTILGSRVYLLESLFAGGSIDVSMHWANWTFDTEGIDYMLVVL